MYSLILLISIVFWNVENCFDYFDGKTSDSDSQFSSYGEKHWSKKKFYAKIETIGKTVLWAGIPDVVGFAEVENAWVVRKICESEVLHKCGYRYVHFDSPDKRGIDVALIYRAETMEKISAYPLRIDSLQTRDILHVELKEKGNGAFWHIFVNHHPSKLGGDKTGDQRRKTVMMTLRKSVDSLINLGATNIVAMGDFNDTPDGDAFKVICPPLVNLGQDLLTTGSATKDIGTIRYNGQWELIDNFLLSPTVSQTYQMSVARPPFLMEYDRQRPGEKPRRTYIGPRYNGGVSDHLPIILSSRDD